MGPRYAREKGAPDARPPDHSRVRPRGHGPLLRARHGNARLPQGVECPGGTQFANDEDGDSVWISPAKEGVAPSPGHYAWLAKTTDDVQAFYDAALQGGTDNGAPGPRDYHPGYYACFVLDPEGNNIEAVLHDYEG